MITSLDLKTIVRLKEKKARYDITDVIMKDISNIIKEFEQSPYKVYVQKSTKHEPTDSYLYLSIQLAKCMMRVYAFNSNLDPVKT